MTTDISLFTASIVVIASGAIALYFTQESLVDVFSRSAAMMHHLSRVRQGLADKMDKGTYEGREELLRDDADRLDMYVPLICSSGPSQ